MVAQSQDRRVSTRTDMLGVTAKVSKNSNDWEDIFPKDISNGGLGFYAATEYPIGEILHLESNVSDFTKSGIDIACNIKIIFASRDKEDNGNFLYGARFVDLSRTHRTNLGVIIERVAQKYPSLLVD